MPTIRPSYWESQTFLRPADVAIVGGGFTGLQTGLEIKLRRPDWEVVVLERSPFGQGASTRNAGFACFGAPTELLEDIELHGAESCWDTVQQRYEGIRRLEELYGPYCDYVNQGGYEVFQDEATMQRVKAALPVLNRGFARITGNQEVWTTRDRVAGVKTKLPVFFNPLEGQLQPAKLAAHLMDRCRSLGIRLLFGAAVETVCDTSVHLSTGAEIRTDQIVLTTNAFTPNLLSDLPLRPVRNQVLLTKPIPDLSLRGCYHHQRGYVYFRNVGSDRILIGGARHLAGEVAQTMDFGPNQLIEKQLMNYLEAFVAIPKEQIQIEQSWSGIIAQGGKSPIVQRHQNGWVLAVRMSGMGVALSARVAQRAADLVTMII